jgi:Xaa-Pro dipeptidase
MRIPTEEYADRLRQLQSNVAAAGFDLFLVTSFDSIYYLTGAGFEPLERPFFLLVYPDPNQPPSLLVPRLELEHLAKARNIRIIQHYWEYPAPAGRGWPDKLRDLIGGKKHLGIEPSLRREIVDELGPYVLHTAPLVEQLRQVKTAAEVAMIRRAAGYADLGVRELLDSSYFGATVAEGFARTRTVTARIIREVDDWELLTTKVLMAVWASPRSSQPHSIPALNDRLCEGSHVALILTRVNGYAAECERTFFTASPSAEARAAFAAMMEARRIALHRIRPGCPCADVDSAVNDFLRQKGYQGEERRLHRTGHGFGLGNHEAPWIAEGSPEVLAENMLISIEPGIYLPSIGGFRHSDTVLVTKEGYELLTSYPRDIDSLTIRGVKPLTRLGGWLTRRALRLRRKTNVTA